MFAVLQQPTPFSCPSVIPDLDLPPPDKYDFGNKSSPEPVKLFDKINKEMS
jgi:hypothetical protein